VIDLHVHSTASDGTLAPEALASRLARDGVTTFSLCDHDTTAGIAAAAAGARAAGMGFLTGIEITAIEDGKDVHVLGYGIDPASAPLAAFLAEQRGYRRARITAIEERLAALGVPVVLDADERRTTDEDRAIGRPVVARALVAAGHVATIAEAFDKYLTPGQPAFVPRTGAPVPEVVAMIARAGGIASLAHPGQTKRDDAIERWVEAGLPAIEVWHSHHDDAAVARYAAIAARYGLLTTGGSDFHGDDGSRVYRVGQVGAPPEAFARLTERLAQPAQVVVPTEAGR
jgi:predicted metal-dependent phosphoesterase TrpH